MIAPSCMSRVAPGPNQLVGGPGMLFAVGQHDADDVGHVTEIDQRLAPVQ